MSQVHPTADVENNVAIGEGTRVWHYCHLRSGVSIGRECTLARSVFVDTNVKVGNRVKIQNYVSIYQGVFIGDGVFVGPHVCFTNDLHPRAVSADKELVTTDDWEVTETRVYEGASIGANATIRCGVTLGRWCMIGAGSVVTKSVADYQLVMGNPARPRGYVCACGIRKDTLGAAQSCTGCKKKGRDDPHS